jgi:iron complex transport system substrate-binding protein
MKKPATFYRLALALILVMSVVALVGCDTSSNAESVATKVIIDCVGREVTIPQTPQRVACLWASTAHMIALVNQQEALAGAPMGLRTDVLMGMKYPPATRLPVPYREGSINAEELMRIDADLVLVRQQTVANTGEVEKLEKLDIPYVIIKYDTIEELKQALTVIGEVFDEQERAQAYIDYMDETFAFVEERLPSQAIENPPVAYHAVNEALRTNAEGDISARVIEAAGVRSASQGQKVEMMSGNAMVTLEEIYNWNPDAIIANEASVTHYVQTDNKWQGLDAVKNKRVYTLPTGLTRWCHPASIEPHMGALFIAKTFYPDEFADVDMQKTVREYYQRFFDVTIDDQMIEDILSGIGMRKPNAPQ